MNVRSKYTMRRAIVVIILALGLATPGNFFGAPIRPALAAVGDLIKTVNVPAAAQCTSGIGTSVAIVPGSMVDLSQYPILLVISCYSSQADSLYFLDPNTDPGTLVKTINTTSTPPQGWGSLSLRGDKGDILGCGNNSDGTHDIYSIDISPFNNPVVPDGTATLLFSAAAGFDICDGVTWDTSDDTVFQGPDVADTIYHYSETGTLLGSFAAPPGCPKSGLAVGGASLFVACNGVLTIHQVNKTDGSVFTSFTSAGSRTEDLECDPVSFADQNKDAMWSKDAFDNHLFAFEIPAGTCGFAGGPPIVPPQCVDTDNNGNIDNDNDGLCDNWETMGMGIDANSDGVVDIQLYDYDVNKDGTIQDSERANLNHKDIYLEIDFMESHQPNNDAVNDVIAAFAAVPNAIVNNPDGNNGIRLHILVDEQAVAHNDNLAFEPCTAAAPAGTPDFDDVKNAMFGTAAERAVSGNVTNAKRFAFHYVLFAHNLLGLDGTSGCAELPGNDFVVSLGGNWTLVGGHNVGDRDEQAGTLMHEFGHNLNLRHGGDDNINCKPNYLSVMSYSRQTEPVVGRPLDYSPAALLPLNENSLSEQAGISGPNNRQTTYGPPHLLVAPADQAIDWSRSDADGDGTFANDTNIIADINFLDLVPGQSDACDGSPGQILQGYNDWVNLKYDFQNTTDFADGIHLTVPEADEITLEEAIGASPDTDGDNVVDVLDNCPLVPNPNQEDTNGNGIGDACENPTTDLSLTKTANPDPVTAGQNLTYNLTVINNGPSNATGTTLVDDLPADVTFVSATPSQGSCTEAGGVVTCNLGAVTNGSNSTVTIVVTTNSGPMITNIASVTANETDPNTTNNNASVNTTVNPAPIGTITVVKQVINNNGGTKTVSDFSLFVDGTPVTSGVATTVAPGTHAVSEQNQPGYTATFSGDCDANGEVTVNTGESKTCIITNDDQPGSITIIKDAVLDDTQDFAFSGTLGDFILDDDPSNNTLSNQAIFTNLTSGSYTVNEAAVNGWDVTAITCNDSDSSGNPAVRSATINLQLGESVTCTFTNQRQTGTVAGMCGGYTVYQNGNVYSAPGWSGSIKVGTGASNTINGSSEADLILGLGGNDKLYGKGGDDVICGGDGNDLIEGAAGNDSLEGGNGNDLLRGQSGDYDLLLGGDGNDGLFDPDGVDGIHGGAGIDLLTFALRKGWRDRTGAARFNQKLSGGYQDDVVLFAILDRSTFFIDITGDERDNPPAAAEGRNDTLALAAKLDPASVILKFEHSLVKAADADAVDQVAAMEQQFASEYSFVLDESGEEDNEQDATQDNRLFLPIVVR